MAEMKLGTKPAKEMIDSPLVTRTNGQIIIAADRLAAADEILHKQMKYEEEVITTGQQIAEALPWDGAIALKTVLEKRWGAALLAPGGAEPMVEVGVGKQVPVQWGRYFIPGAEAVIAASPCNFLQTDVERLSDGRFVFKVVARVQRKWNAEYQAIAMAVAEEVRAHSIYRGKAIRVKLLNADGDKLPFPDIQFIDVSEVRLDEIAFPEDVEAALDDNVYTPIRFREACEAVGAPRRRGVLLWGKPGVGKTLVARALAKIATEAKLTYLLGEAREFEHLMGLAMQLQGDEGVVLFAEDIDRIVSGEKRTTEIDRILNIVDGVQTKTARVFIVLTTNDLGAIREEMLREGRLDVTLHLPTPDGPTVERLMRVYGRGLVAQSADLTLAGRAMAGCVPATVREAVERAKFSFIGRTGGEVKDVTLSAEDLLRAARSVMRQRTDIAASRPDKKRHPYVEGSRLIAEAIRDSQEMYDVDDPRFAGAGRVPAGHDDERLAVHEDGFDDND